MPLDLRFLRRFSGTLLAVFLVLSGVTAFAASAAPTRAYDIPASSAEAALKAFSEQSGKGVIASTDLVRGVTTNAVKGEFTAAEALDQMLIGTGLIGTEDRKSGTFAVRKETTAESKNAPSRLAEAEAANQQSRAKIKDGAVQLENFEVSATKVTGIVNQGVIPREENQAVRYLVISRDDIERTGVSNVSDLMRFVPGNAQMGTTTQRALAISGGGTGFFASNGDSVDLRGLGSNQTLVMINGRRLFGSDTFVGPDISRIPLSAIERVEILPVSGSALYGANSVGGVINFILRRDYAGTEIGAFLGASTAGGAEEARATLLHGMSFNKGRSNFTVSLDAHRQTGMTFADRAYYEPALSHPGLQPSAPNFLTRIVPFFVGPRAVITTSSPLGLGIATNPTARFASVPAGSTGTGLTPNSFNGTVAQATASTESFGRAPLADEAKSRSAFLSFEHEIFGPALSVYGELTWRESLQHATYPRPPGGIAMAANNPLNPFRTNVTPGFVGRAIVVYGAASDFPDSYQETDKQTRRAVIGFKGDFEWLGERQFKWALDGSWDENKTESLEQVVIAARSAATAAGLYNPFRDLSVSGPLSPSEVNKFRYDLHYDREPVIKAVNFRLNGSPFDLWSNPVAFSLGAESRREIDVVTTTYENIGEYNYLLGGPGPFLVNSAAKSTRTVDALYAEVQVPLITPKRPRFGLHSLDVSGGIRLEKYSDFAEARPPAVAMKLGVTRDLALRVSYSEGFQPPTISQLRAPVTTTQVTTVFTDPLRPNSASPASHLRVSGGRPDLRPETARTWDAGVIITPRGLPGFTFNASYFYYEKDNVVTSLNIVDTILYAPERITRAPATPDDIAAGRPGEVTQWDARAINIALQKLDGIDFSMRWNLPESRFGNVTLLGDGTWTRRFERQARPGAPIVDSVGLLPFFSSSSNVPVAWRANGTVSWQRGQWSATVRGSYISSFESNTTNPTPRNPGGLGLDGDKIAQSIVCDLQVSYEVRHGLWNGSGNFMQRALSGTKWTLGVRNLFDTEPPYWSEAARGFYAQGVDPRQRFVFLQFKKNL